MISQTGSAPFWTVGKDALCARLRCDDKGLSSIEIAERLRNYGPNADAPARRAGIVVVVLRRLLEPLCLILLAAAAVAAATGDGISGAIIVAILALSTGLDTMQEHRVVKAAELLRRSVAIKAEALMHDDSSSSCPTPTAASIFVKSQSGWIEGSGHA